MDPSTLLASGPGDPVRARLTGREFPAAELLGEVKGLAAVTEAKVTEPFGADVDDTSADASGGTGDQDDQPAGGGSKGQVGTLLQGGWRTVGPTKTPATG